ncbi:MAG: T9SS type A sorting domain-containing protein [Crocinitomicaceae bacterium]|nr:T9SS type A sorting domain-containing protein [Crocinitomicaceae bacterium]
MKKSTLLLAFLLLFILPSAFAQTYTTGVVNLSSTAGLAMTAKIDVGTQVTLTLTGPSGRWFALGFNASSMTNGTDVVGVHSATTLSAFDCKLTGFAAPVTDAQQNWTITSDVVSAGIRTIIATRALNTGDANDYIFPASPTAISLIWSRSSTASFSYSNHGGSNRGITAASFTFVPPPAPPAAPTGATNQTLCAGATVSQLSATGTAIQWYAAPTGGSPLASNTVMVNGTTYYATQTVNGLESTNRLAVTITLNNIPAAPSAIDGNLDFCYSGGVQLFNTPSIQGASSYVWTTPVGATGSSTGTNISLIFSPSFVSGTLSVLAQNPCGQSAPVSVVINQHLQASTTLNVTSCDPYSFNGQNYAQSGSYIYAGQTIYGCDSTVTLNLTITPAVETTINENACGSFPWNGQTLWTSGVYIDSLQSAAGCDSVVLLNLNLYPIYAIVMDSTVLDAFTWNGIDYATSGSYTQFFTSVNGCDSSVTINLTIEDSGLDENTTSYLAYPNPVTDGTLWISGLNDIASYQIWDTQGRLLQVGTTIHSIAISDDITNGTYLLLINEQRLRFQVCKH